MSRISRQPSPSSSSSSPPLAQLLSRRVEAEGEDNYAVCALPLGERERERVKAGEGREEKDREAREKKPMLFLLALAWGRLVLGAHALSSWLCC